MAGGNSIVSRPRVLLILAAAVLLLAPVALVVGWIVVAWAGWNVGLVLGGVVASASIVLLGRAQPVEPTDDDRSAVWNAIPHRQYAGRRVDSGRTTREEQERAVETIKREAEALDSVGEHADDPEPGRPNRRR